MSRIFVSYSRRDGDFARRLATDLDRLGADVWIDVQDIPPGVNWSNAIHQGLNDAEVMLIIISPDSMASSNVEDEWQYFKDHGKPLIPVLWRPTELHFQLHRLQYVKFHQREYERALAELSQELRRLGIALKGSAPPPRVKEAVPPPVLAPPAQAKPPASASPHAAPTLRQPVSRPRPRRVRRRLFSPRAVIVGLIAVVALGVLLLGGDDDSGDREPAGVSPGGYVMVTIGEGAIITMGPGTDYEVLARVERSRAVQAWARTDDGRYFQVELDERVGYVPADQVTVEGDIEQLPVIATELLPHLTVREMSPLRSGPGPDFEVVGEVAPGQQFPVIGRSIGDPYFRLQRVEGAGWIHEATVAPAGEIEHLPVFAGAPAHRMATVRSGPGEEYEPLFQIGPGEWLALSGRLPDERYFRVSLDMRTGWVTRDDLERRDELSDLPVIVVTRMQVEAPLLDRPGPSAREIAWIPRDAMVLIAGINPEKSFFLVEFDAAVGWVEHAVVEPFPGEDALPVAGAE